LGRQMSLTLRRDGLPALLRGVPSLFRTIPVFCVAPMIEVSLSILFIPFSLLMAAISSRSFLPGLAHVSFLLSVTVPHFPLRPLPVKELERCLVDPVVGECLASLSGFIVLQRSCSRFVFFFFFFFAVRAAAFFGRLVPDGGQGRRFFLGSFSFPRFTSTLEPGALFFSVQS